MDSCGESLRALKAGLKRYRKVTVVAACCSAVAFFCHLTTKTGTSQSIAQLIIQKTSLPSVSRDTGVESTSKSDLVEQAAAMSHERGHKIIICTLDSFSGGPEALFQLTFALFDRGFNVYRTSELASVLRPLYPDWEKVPSLPRYGIRKLLAPGDIVVVPEYTGVHGLPKVKGVRVVRWILAGVHSPIPGLFYLHHSFHLAHANKSPASTVVMPYMHTNRTGFREGMYQLGGKRNTICVDNDAKAVADLITESGLRSKLNNDLEIKVVEGMQFAEIEELYRRCKVVIDKALPGMERVPLEAASFGAIVLLDDDPSNSIGAEWLDFPIPADYVGSWDVDRLESTLYKALTSYEQEMMKFEPLRRRIAAMESQFVDAVDRVFGETATFLIPCNKPKDGANCLRAAISVLLVSPLSMVRLITRDDEAAFMATNADLYKVLGEAHMDGLMTAGPMNLTSHFDELVSGAPNHRVILMAPDMVLIDGDELRSWSRHNSSSHQDCVLWVPAGLDVNLMGEHDLPGRICLTLARSFEDFSVIEDGNFMGDPAYLHRFAHLCSSPIWRLVMGASSQPWLQFCGSIERSGRS